RPRRLARLRQKRHRRIGIGRSLDLHLPRPATTTPRRTSPRRRRRNPHGRFEGRILALFRGLPPAPTRRWRLGHLLLVLLLPLLFRLRDVLLVEGDGLVRAARVRARRGPRRQAGLAHPAHGRHLLLVLLGPETGENVADSNPAAMPPLVAAG